jgi:hypothetical protein
MKTTQIGCPDAAGYNTKLPVARSSRYIALGAGLLLSACAFINPAMASEQVVIKDNHIKLGGNSYFRRGSEIIHLGSFGDKKSPVGQQNYLEVDGTIPKDKLTNIEKVQVYEIDYQKTSKTDLCGTLKDAAGVFGFSADVAWEKAKSGQLKLVELVIDNNHITKAANQSSPALKSLKNRGNSARIANKILVVMTAEMAEIFQRGTTANMSATDGKLQLTAGATTSSSGSNSVTLSKDSTFAYGLVKLDWGKGKDKIDSVEDDWWGAN